MGRSAVNQLDIFRELCGDDSATLKNVIFATNRWDLLEREEVGVRRQIELENDHRFWKPMCKKGSKVRRYDGTTESAIKLIQLIMRNKPQPLKIQQELVDDGKPLSETRAGRFADSRKRLLNMQAEQAMAMGNTLRGMF